MNKVVRDKEDKSSTQGNKVKGKKERWSGLMELGFFEIKEVPMFFRESKKELRLIYQPAFLNLNGFISFNC